MNSLWDDVGIKSDPWVYLTMHTYKCTLQSSQTYVSQIRGAADDVRKGFSR